MQARFVFNDLSQLFLRYPKPYPHELWKSVIIPFEYCYIYHKIKTILSNFAQSIVQIFLYFV